MQTATLEAFETERPRLLNVAYRLTGSVVDAEDAVQDAWLRLERADADIPPSSPLRSEQGGAPSNLQAWLTTVVSRLCLDRLGSAAKRRETYVGQWLPEPIVTTFDATDDPLASLVRDEDARFAALVVLEVLPPAQRVAFVLHDAFDVPFDEIAEVLDVDTANARKLASRARKAVAEPPPPVSDEEHLAAVTRFVEAMATGDLDAIIATLHPDAIVMGDANGTTNTAVNVIHGAEKFARFYLGLMNRYGPNALEGMTPVLVNGELGFVTFGWIGASAKLSSPPRVAAFAVRDGKVCASYDIANPEKHAGVTLPDWPPQLSRALGTHRRS